jgi:hypothetical protein
MKLIIIVNDLEEEFNLGQFPPSEIKTFIEMIEDHGYVINDKTYEIDETYYLQEKGGWVINLKFIEFE